MFFSQRGRSLVISHVGLLCFVCVARAGRPLVYDSSEGAMLPADGTEPQAQAVSDEPAPSQHSPAAVAGADAERSHGESIVLGTVAKESQEPVAVYSAPSPSRTQGSVAMEVASTAVGMAASMPEGGSRDADSLADRHHEGERTAMPAPGNTTHPKHLFKYLARLSKVVPRHAIPNITTPSAKGFHSQAAPDLALARAPSAGGTGQEAEAEAAAEGGSSTREAPGEGADIPQSRTAGAAAGSVVARRGLPAAEKHAEEKLGEGRVRMLLLVGSIAALLVIPLHRCLGPPPPRRKTPEELLAAVYADAKREQEQRKERAAAQLYAAETAAGEAAADQPRSGNKRFLKTN